MTNHLTVKNRIATCRLWRALPISSVRVAHARLNKRSGSVAGLLLCTIALASCASPKAPPPEVQAPQYWSITRTIVSDKGMVTLFDPTDLSHHKIDPEGWYRYDFAFANDLETGRFAAVFTDNMGNQAVRLTHGPLTDEEKQVAGPNAIMRLRVTNHRLLLAGGDTWPSNLQSPYAHALDSRWVDIENGDYQVVLTALDRQQGATHDLVIQLIPAANMLSVSYAPGIPYLVVGEPAGVKGIGAGGLRYRESCGAVQRTATWSPLSSDHLPLPGTLSTMNVSANLHYRGSQRQSNNQDAALPVLIARNPTPGTLGVFIKPDEWKAATVDSTGEMPVTARVLCTVKLGDIVPSAEGFVLNIDPLPAPLDQLPVQTLQDLVGQFDNWIRLSGDPAWRFKSAQIHRTQQQRSVLLGIMDFLSLRPKHAESLLQETNAGLAERLIEHMTSDYASVDQ